jgi:hypothetical protein
MALTDLSDKEIGSKLSGGELGSRRTAIAQAILRRRKNDKAAAWLRRHGWLEAIISALGLAALFLPKKPGPRNEG